MNNNTILAMMAGALLALGVTSIVPAAYAGGDDGNKVEAEDDSQVGVSDCDDNELISEENRDNDFSTFGVDCSVFIERIENLPFP